MKAFTTSHKFRFLVAAVALGIWGFHQTSRADAPPRPLSFKQLAADSRLIFLGRVTAIAYKNSLPTQQHPKGLPHTFVTYQVLLPLKGQVSSSFTLRFLGGVNTNGQVMDISSHPHFDLGDQDVLFIRNNGKRGCPLRGCEQGRFRIVQDRVYSEGGNTVCKSGNQSVQLGSFQPLPEALNWTIRNPQNGQSVTLTTRGSKLVPSPPEVSQFHQAEFIQLIRNIVAGMPTLPPEISAQIQSPIPGMNIRAVKPPSIPLPPLPPPGSPSDEEELRRFSENGENPVLPH